MKTNIEVHFQIYISVTLNAMHLFIELIQTNCYKRNICLQLVRENKIARSLEISGDKESSLQIPK